MGFCSIYFEKHVLKDFSIKIPEGSRKKGRGKIKTEICDWCQAEMRKKFVVNKDGLKQRLCQTCFSVHLNGGNDKLLRKIMGQIDDRTQAL